MRCVSGELRIEVRVPLGRHFLERPLSVCLTSFRMLDTDAGEGRLTVDIGNFNLRRSQVRKVEKISFEPALIYFNPPRPLTPLFY